MMMKSSGEGEIPMGTQMQFKTNKPNAQLWHKETSMSFTIPRKIVRSKDKLWKINHGKMRSKSQYNLEIFSKPNVKYVQVTKSSRLAQTSSHYKDTFKNRFKIDLKLATKARMKT